MNIIELISPLLIFVSLIVLGILAVELWQSGYDRLSYAVRVILIAIILHVFYTL